MNNHEKLSEIKKQKELLEKEEQDLLLKIKSEKLPIERLFEFVDKNNWKFGISEDYDYSEKDIVYYLDYIGNISDLFSKINLVDCPGSMWLKNSKNEITIEVYILHNQIIVESIWIDDLIEIIKDNNLQIIQKDFFYIKNGICAMELLIQNYKNILKKVEDL